MWLNGSCQVVSVNSVIYGQKLATLQMNFHKQVPHWLFRKAAIQNMLYTCLEISFMSFLGSQSESGERRQEKQLLSRAWILWYISNTALGVAINSSEVCSMKHFLKN